MRIESHILLIGPPRTGTTTLFEALSNAKGVAPTIVKEACALLDPSVLSIDDYLLRCRTSVRSTVTLEASPQYFCLPDAVNHSLLASMKGRMKVVVGLRLPSDRLLSWYLHLKQKVSAGNNLSVAQFEEDCLKSRRLPSAYSHQLGLVESETVRWLQRWESLIGRDSIRLYRFQDLERGPLDLVIRLAKQLDLEFETPPVVPRANQSLKIRSRTMQALATVVSRNLEPLLNSNLGIKDALRRSYYRVNTSKRRSACEFSEPFVKRLQELDANHEAAMEDFKWL